MTGAGLGFSGIQFPLTWATRQESEAYYQLSLKALKDYPQGLVINPHLKFGWIREILDKSSLRESVYGVLGKHVFLENTFLLIKSPASDFEVPVHQDGVNENLELDPDLSVSAWLAISEANSENGGLYVYPGLHRNGYYTYKRIRTPEGNPLTLSDTKVLDGVPKIEVRLDPGEFCLFSTALPHCSGKNRTTKHRTGLNVRFCIADGVIRRSQPDAPSLESY